MNIPEELKPDLEYLVESVPACRKRMTVTVYPGDLVNRTNLELSLANIGSLREFNDTLKQANEVQTKLSKNANFLGWAAVIFTIVEVILAAIDLLN